MFTHLAQQLDKRESQNALRKLKVHGDLIDFCSNDYLGLARNKTIFQSVNQEFEKESQINKLGATGSRLIAGTSQYCVDLEIFLAKLHHSESALIFNSGYTANLAVLSTLPQKGDIVFYDELSHACIKEGIRLSFAEKFSFKHNDLDDLKRKLEKCNAKTIYVAVESIYSMDGDESPLLALTELCKQFNAIIIVDEAHSTAHLGTGGNGLVCQLGLEKEIPIRIHTYGKALGCHGATVIAPKVITDYLINFARPFIYTTALPLHSLVNIKMAYKYLSTNNEEVKLLNKNISLFKSLTNTLPKVESNSPIQAILIPGNDEVKNTSTNLQKAGFDIRPIMSPTVKEGGERLRICIHTYNTEKQITELCGLLNKLISK